MDFEILIPLNLGEGLISHVSIQFCSSNAVIFAVGSQTMNNDKIGLLQYFFKMLSRKSITIFGEFYTIQFKQRLVNYFISLIGSLHVV